MKTLVPKFMVDVVDDSMSPALMKGDLVTVRSGFEVDDGHIIVALVTDDETRSTKLYIRKVVKEPTRIILKATNDKYPPLIFENGNTQNVRVIGIVTTLHRDFGSTRMVVTARIAKDNRRVLETASGNLVAEPVMEWGDAE